jgi:hypothetical protein
MVESTLELFAELAIGLVGFAGVVSALGHSRLSAGTRSFRIGALLINSVTALTFSILPMLLLAHGLSESTLWMIVTILLAFTQASTMVWSALRIRPLTNEEVPNLIRFVMFSLLLLTILYELYGIFFQPQMLSAIYVVALAMSFGVGLFHFCVLVLSIQTSTEST